MPVHLIKIAVGCESVAHLREWQRDRLRETGKLQHVTRFTPKRADEIISGGSIYWIIGGEIRCRQRIRRLDAVTDDDGNPACALVLDTKVVEVAPVGRRPHQGWRYLDEKDAPPDLTELAKGRGDAMPPKLLAELRSLGLI
ncbi:MAG: DUF1489 family protein [Alphaproteobacteria bacterium]|nr:DUF1489 family protein [Alphaproteobacteria bacterium]